MSYTGSYSNADAYGYVFETADGNISLNTDDYGGILVISSSEYHFTVPNLTPETNYDWQMYSLASNPSSANAIQPSEKTPILNVTTASVPPELITDFTILSKTETSIEVGWVESSNAESYRVWATKQGSSVIEFDQNYPAGTNSAIITLAAIDAGQYFNCYITSERKSLVSAETSLVANTLCAAPTALTLLSQQTIDELNCEVTLTWLSSEGVVGYYYLHNLTTDEIHNVYEGTQKTLTLACAQDFSFLVYKENNNDINTRSTPSNTLSITTLLPLVLPVTNLLQLDASETSASIEWSASSGATLYKVYYGDGSTWTLAGETVDTQYEITGLVAAVNLFAKVESYNGDGATMTSGHPTVALQLAPATITGLSQTGSIQTDTIRVGWDGSNYESGDLLQLHLVNLSTMEETTSSLPATSYAENISSFISPENSTGETFSITAQIQKQGNPYLSVASAPITAYTAPKNLQLQHVSSDVETLNISWTSSPSATDYTVEALVGGVVQATNIATTPDVYQFTNLSITDGLEFDILVKPKTSSTGLSYYYDPASSYPVPERMYTQINPVSSFNASLNGNNVDLNWFHLKYVINGLELHYAYHITCAETGLDIMADKSATTFSHTDAILGQASGTVLTYNIVVKNRYELTNGITYANSEPVTVTVTVP
jgi:hypothetical protein